MSTRIPSTPPPVPLSGGPASILGPDGSIARALPSYEVRPEQLQMAEAVAHAIASRSHLMVEAGTGVGKSFAYLVPALLAVQDKRLSRVVIATHTISLQQQLIEKDLPFLKTIMPRPFSFALAKGRSNDLSRRRLRSALEEGPTLFDEGSIPAHHLARLDDWSRSTTDGSRSDLSFRPDPRAWGEAESQTHDCRGKSCDSYLSCFYYAARDSIQGSQIVVCNYALYMMHLKYRDQRPEGAPPILPPHELAIFDEAQTIEDVAADHLGAQVASNQVAYLLGRLLHEHKELGLLPRARGYIKEKTFKHLVTAVQRCRTASEETFGRIAGEVRAAQTGPYQPAALQRFRGGPDWEQHLGEELLKLGAMLRDSGDHLAPPHPGRGCTPEEHEAWESRTSGPAADAGLALTAASRRAVELGTDIVAWWDHDETDDEVFWAEVEDQKLKTKDRPLVTLTTAPIDVAPTLQKGLWSQVPAILTSATLATGSPPQFDLYRAALGLGHDCATLAVGSPFHFEAQCTIHLNRSLPDPTAYPRRAFEDAAIRALPSYLQMTSGRAFCLFTSRAHLERAVGAIRPWCTTHGINLFVQGEDLDNHKMIVRFKENHAAGGRSVLLGLNSFWQGVDVPGEALSNVIIVRLPFTPPDQPLNEARCEAIARRGGKPFFERTIQECAIKLKQGFGRLIRSMSDEGIVVILDPRVLTKQKTYGGYLLRSLPDCEVVIDDLGRFARGMP